MQPSVLPRHSSHTSPSRATWRSRPHTLLGLRCRCHSANSSCGRGGGHHSPAQTRRHAGRPRGTQGSRTPSATACPSLCGPVSRHRELRTWPQGCALPSIPPALKDLLPPGSRHILKPTQPLPPVPCPPSCPAGGSQGSSLRAVKAVSQVGAVSPPTQTLQHEPHKARSFLEAQLGPLPLCGLGQGTEPLCLSFFSCSKER